MIDLKNIFKYYSWAVLLILPNFLYSQQKGVVNGTVLSSNSKEKLAFCTVIVLEIQQAKQTNDKGEFTTDSLAYGDYTLVFQFLGYQTKKESVTISKPTTKLKATLTSTTTELKTIQVNAKADGVGNMKRLNSVEDVLISEGKKNEVVVLENINANKATNQSRQIYSRIPGLNIWESDGAGIQLGIGGRGLNPSRTSNFNTRQNGYDISADALGYPESYYTPPSEAVKEIQLIRGAASLQFGTQFGGLLNFVLQDGPKDEGVEGIVRQTVGSFGLSNTFASLGFNKKSWKNYTFLQYKQGNDWRPNSSFKVFSGGFNLKKSFSKKASANLEFTKMYYLAQQPGGLTDAQFESDPSVSNRERNWFEVDWNLMATNFHYDFTAKTRLKTQFFGLLASRKALGVLNGINRVDNPSSARNLITGEFKNVGNETRFLHIYTVKERYCAFLVGARYYQGYNLSKQGSANTSNKPNFSFTNSPNEGSSSYEFPSRNIALFSENIFRVTDKLSITPGVRFEFINTNAEGTYTVPPVLDGANNIQNPAQTYNDNQNNKRSILIGGIGLNYKKSNALDIYANLSQNYRSINFTDMQIQNQNFRIDPNLEDERGYNMDLGIRGSVDNKINYDVSGFVMLYDNRIGTANIIENSIAVRVRTNIAKAVTRGIEAMVEVDWWKIFTTDSSKVSLRTFINGAIIDARYTESDISAYENKFVELVPPVTVKTGISFDYMDFGISYQYSYVQEHFSDATNAEAVANAIIGTIPSYSVMDLSMKYSYKRFKIETGINNLSNESYFTRRATGYPGPGIIPSPIRNFYLTLQVKL